MMLANLSSLNPFHEHLGTGVKDAFFVNRFLHYIDFAILRERG